MRVVSLLFAGTFVLCAAVQWNDPDPIRWMGFYLVAAVLAGGASFLAIPRPIYVAVACVSFAWTAALLPEVLSEASFTGTEVERECGGVFLVGAALLGLHRMLRAQRAAAP